MCKLQHNTLPSRIELIQLEPNNSLKLAHNLAKHEDSCLNKKMILTQFWLIAIFRIQDVANTVTYTHLYSFPFQSVSCFSNKQKTLSQHLE